LQPSTNPFRLNILSLTETVNTPNAFIHPGARIHPSVRIEPFCVIYDNVEIAEGSVIGPHVTIYPGARIGKNVRIYPNAVISGEPQDLKYEGEDTLTVIGDNTIIRECVTVNRGTKWLGKTVVGNNCLLMAYSHVAHDCVIGDNCVIANNVNLAGHIVIEDFVNIGGVTAVQQFLRIGKYSFVTGGSLVRKDVPPFVKAAREPLQYAGVNVVGLKRRGFSDEQIKNIEDIYRIVFVQHSNVSKALVELSNGKLASEERDTIVSFIKNSKDGIIKGLVAHHSEHGDVA
jgi:UDP-N-acetylglucosamine acyltransferase